MFLREEKGVTSCDLAPALPFRDASGESAPHRDTSPRINRDDDQSLSIIAGNDRVCLVNIAQHAVAPSKSPRIRVIDQRDWREATCDDSEPY
jgi:hypothetical protein